MAKDEVGFGWNEIIQEMNKENFDIYAHDKQMQDEFDAILNMIQEAMKHHLETEVIAWFGQYRANGEEVIPACQHALGEWIK